MMCNKQLSTGEELYIIDENKFVCKDDYLSNTTVKDTNLLSGKIKVTGKLMTLVTVKTILNNAIYSSARWYDDNIV